MEDRDQRIVSDLNTTYLDEEALVDIKRIGVTLAEGEPLTVFDYEADDQGNPTWVVAEGVAHYDAERRAWQIWYSTNDVRGEQRS